MRAAYLAPDTITPTPAPHAYTCHMRPLPGIPHGPRRRFRPAASHVLLACPRVSPRWELAALQALLKPQTRGAIAHSAALQTWPAEAENDAIAICDELSRRLGVPLAPHFPPQGDAHFVLTLPRQFEDVARGVALVLSTRFRGLWFSLDRLLVHDGHYYR